ncbi:OFA family MFS transporter [Streptomyces rameus]|uniref:OFA family MFS transporter n=1 Tax=Streptomyces rameus TaxID=68261 RepID=A0ABP6NJE0_9ACTN
METTDPPASLLCREVKDRRGRVYRVGESAADILGHGRVWMVVLPWLGMTGIACAGYAFLTARGGLRDAHQWGGELFRPAGLWALCQTAVALPAGLLRESRRLTARTAVLTGAFGTLLGYLSLAFAAGLPLVRLGFAVVGGVSAGLVHSTCLTLPGKWYPERRGGPTGFVASGLAFGAVPLLPVLGSGAGRADHRFLLAATGAGVCLVVASAGWFFRDPPKNWWPPHIDPLRVAAGPVARRARERNPPAVRQFGTWQAARTPALWLMCLCVLGTAGAAALGCRWLVPLAREAGFTGHTVRTAAALALTAGAGLGAVGVLSDRVGRRATLTGACLVLGGAQFGLLAAAGTGSVSLFLGSAGAAGLAGGAVPALVAALAADHFGENHSAGAYGLVAGSAALAVLAGLGAAAGDPGGRAAHGAFVLAGYTGLACAVPALFLTAPGRPRARRIVPNPHPLGEEMA